jgi:hypothetical protein
VKRAVKGVPWFLTSLGVGLLMLGVLLAPVGQKQLRADSNLPGCAGSECGMGNGNCNSKDPNVGSGCTMGTCASSDPNVDCSGCTCKKLYSFFTKRPSRKPFIGQASLLPSLFFGACDSARASPARLLDGL